MSAVALTSDDWKVGEALKPFFFSNAPNILFFFVCKDITVLYLYILYILLSMFEVCNLAKYVEMLGFSSIHKLQRCFLHTERIEPAISLYFFQPFLLIAGIVCFFS